MLSPFAGLLCQSFVDAQAFVTCEVTVRASIYEGDLVPLVTDRSCLHWIIGLSVDQ